MVEDQPDVRRLLRRILERKGFPVLEAADGVEALAVHQSNRDRITAVVTDVMMPEMGGRELARRLAELDPKLPVMYVSGYIDTMVESSQFPEETILLKKPFLPDELSSGLELLLETAVQ